MSPYVCVCQYSDGTFTLLCGAHKVMIADKAKELEAENDRLRAELRAAGICVKMADKRTEDALAHFEEARKIIEEVSHSPEFKKFHYLGQEQDPCGVHAFTKKNAPRSGAGSYLMHQISCPYLTGGLCSCSQIAVIEKHMEMPQFQNETCPPDVCPLCYHRKDDPAHLPCMSSDNRK